MATGLARGGEPQCEEGALAESNILSCSGERSHGIPHTHPWDPTHPQPEQGWTHSSTHMIGVMTYTALCMLQSSTENRQGNAV